MYRGMGAGIGLGGFALGAGIGAIIALLYAPRAGVETRAMVSEKVDEYWGQGQELYARGVDRATETYESAAGRVNERVSNFKPYVSDRSDELRDKIDVARERIAQEIDRNATSAHDIISDKIPSAASKVDEIADAAQEVAAKAADAISPKKEAEAEAEAPAVEDAEEKDE